MQIQEQTREFIEVLREFYQTGLSSSILEFGQGEHNILTMLAESEKQHLLPGDICAELKVSSARVAAALNGLEKKGMVVRQTAPFDRRKVLIFITKKGEEYIKMRQALFLVTLDDALMRLGEGDLRELIRIMKRLLAFSLEQDSI